MGVYCVNDDYCVSGTGFPSYDDVYSQSGTYNSRDYYVGTNNGYYIFYDAGSFWCLATTLGGSPCFLQGKYPYSGLCPDLTFEYVNSAVCPTPTPTPTVGCDVFNFEAKLITNIDPTPSQTYTPSPTPTLTQTPTSTNVCPNIYVDAFITGITPTTTPTPTMTPSVRILRYRSNQIQCNFSGDVTFVTVDSVISCPVSKQFQDCNNGFMYYTTNIVNNPSGGDLSQFMIFLGVVDGSERCITYIGNNPTYIGTNNITLSSGPIGYSNLGQCSLCAIQLTPTPTPTITMTPSSPSVLNLCPTFVNGFGFINTYDVETNTLTSLTVPNLSNWNDIANTQTKLFLSNNDKIKEWDIISSPFSAIFVRELDNSESSVAFGPGLFAINNNKLVTANTKIGLNPQYVFEINLPSSPLTSLDSSNYVTLFDLPVNRYFSGDLLVTTNGKILITNSAGSDTWYLTQYSYTTSDFEFEIQISPTIINPTSIFIQNGLLYIIDSSAIVYNVDLNSPYTITVITSPGVSIYGASNSLSCNNISFEFTETTYYIMKKCFDNEGPQNYIYQTQPTNVQFLNAAIYDTITESCWSYQGTTTIIPQNTVDDIVIYQGNYFTTTNSVYQTCSACLNFTPCEVPQGVESYILINVLKNSPTSSSIVISTMELDEICTTYSQVYDINNQTGNSSFQYQGIQVEEISVGTRVYKLATNPCNCINDGNYIIYPQPSTSFDFPQTVYIITIEGCFISQITQCDGENGGITNVSGGGITFPSGGTGGSGGGTGGTGGGSGGSGGNGGNTPGGGPNPSSTCECTAVRTISGFQGTAFYTDCNGNPAQITVPGGTGIAGTACFCRQPNTPVTGAVTVEACQSSFGQGTINNICSSTISCS